MDRIKDREKKKIQLYDICLFFAAFFFAIVIILFVLGKAYLKNDAFYPGECGYLDISWEYETESGKKGTTVFPCNLEVKYGEGIIFTSKLPDEGINDDTYICILGGRDYEVYVDGKLRYIFDSNTNLYPAKGVKSLYSPVKMSGRDCGKEISIVKNEDKVDNGNANRIRIGTLAAIKYDIFKENAFKFLAALGLFLLSLLIFILTFVVNRLYDIKTREFGALAFSMMAVSAWIMTDSYLFQIIFKTTYVDGLMSFILISMLPIPFFVYMDEIQDHRYKKQYAYVMAGLVLDGLICSILHFTNIAIYEQTLIFNNLCVVIAAIVMMFYIIRDVFIEHITDYIAVAVGIIIMIICTVLEVAFINTGNTGFVGGWMTIGLYFMLIMALVDSGRRAVSYERKRREAIEASIVKSNFLANMSHEIRTPINTIMGMNEMIIRENKDEKIGEYADYIKRSGDLLLTIIGDVLDFSKIESGKLNPVPAEYETRVLLKDMKDFIHERGKAKGLEVNLDIDPLLPSRLYGDVDRIKQILINLTTNAIKYTKEGSVTFKAYAEKSEADIRDPEDGKKIRNIHFEVIDTGMGIKEEDIGRLFDSFTRMDENKNRSIQGTGLGLAIVKSLTEIMKGQISVTSTYGKGSTFHVYLPQKLIDEKAIGEDWDVRKEENRSAGKAYSVSFKAPEARLLAVDDTASNLLIIKYLLKNTDIVIDAVGGGEEAIQKAEEIKYDVILLDHMMPEPDGIEVLNRIKSNKEGLNKSTPVIVLTANATSESRAQYLACGFDDYLTKPVDGKALEETLRGFISDEKLILKV